MLDPGAEGPLQRSLRLRRVELNEMSRGHGWICP